MRLGIIGLPQSGKTTIFNALTRGDTPTTMSGGRIEVHSAIVEVPDPRVDRLSQIFNPEKTTYARVEYADIAGLDGGTGKTGISGQLLNELSQMDGFLHTVRCFEDESVPHQAGGVDAQRDIEAMISELLLNDMIAIEGKLERLADEWQKGGRDKAVIEREQKLFERLQAALTDGTPLRGVKLSSEEQKEIGGYGFLTLKPMLTVLNLGEGQEAPPVDDNEYSLAVPLQGKLEMEIAQLPPDETQVFLEEYGIEEPSLYRMIRESYELLGLISFFTVWGDEVRSWTVRRGAAAPEAAGVIHTDLQKGFIRAEVVAYPDLDALGSWAAARDGGKLRVEGKTYLVQDGDVIRVRFNI
jgi:hypothetical protein